MRRFESFALASPSEKTPASCQDSRIIIGPQPFSETSAARSALISVSRSVAVALMRTAARCIGAYDGSTRPKDEPTRESAIADVSGISHERDRTWVWNHG